MMSAPTTADTRGDLPMLVVAPVPTYVAYLSVTYVTYATCRRPSRVVVYCLYASFSSLLNSFHVAVNCLRTSAFVISGFSSVTLLWLSSQKR